MWKAAIIEYKQNHIPPPGCLRRCPEDPAIKQQEDFKENVFRFQWELGNALYYIRNTYDRKKEQYAMFQGEMETKCPLLTNPLGYELVMEYIQVGQPDINDYLACIQSLHKKEKGHKKWTNIEKLIQIYPYMNETQKHELFTMRENEDLLKSLMRKKIECLSPDERLKYIYYL